MFKLLMQKLLNEKMFILAGLGGFVLLFTAPFWLNFLFSLFTGDNVYERPKIALPTEYKECVSTRDYMRAEHMQLLDTWRDMAVREGKREYVDANGNKWDINLQNTCMSCHANKPDFCDTCHTSNSVDPYCWDCHVEPKGNQQ